MKMSISERREAQKNPNNPAYYFAPNAFINVIDIQKECVIACVPISGPALDQVNLNS